MKQHSDKSGRALYTGPGYSVLTGRVSNFLRAEQVMFKVTPPAVSSFFMSHAISVSVKILHTSIDLIITF